MFYWALPQVISRGSYSNYGINPVIFLNKNVMPLGIAAGLDKNAQCIKALYKMGFDIVEIGTITPQPQFGNKKPRIFRLAGQKSIINSMGFPNHGADIIEKRIEKFYNNFNMNDKILGINIGKNKDGTNEDYLVLIKRFHKYADYLALNISSPNTVGLRSIHDTIDEFLSTIYNFLQKHSIKTPIFIKLSPDITNETLQNIYNNLQKYGFHAILTNTTIDKTDVIDSKLRHLAGGLSGDLLQDKSIKMLELFQKMNDDNINIISVGGINSANDIKDRLKKGASIAQVYSSLIYGNI